MNGGLFGIVPALGHPSTLFHTVSSPADLSVISNFDLPEFDQILKQTLRTFRDLRSNRLHPKLSNKPINETHFSILVKRQKQWAR